MKMLKLFLAFLLIVTFFGSTEVLAVTGGEAVRDGEYPFMVSIRDLRNCHICGGTIIGDRWVVTGNPCYSRSWFGSVMFGSTSLDNDCGELNNSTQIMVDDVLYNPWASNLPPYTHDLVLIHLSKPITFSENAQPVQLPEDDEAWLLDKKAIILGWANSDWGKSQNDLQKVTLPLYSDNYCTDSAVWSGWAISDSDVMKCGGEPNVTYYCNNDYGGPLLMDGKQYGIISYIYTGRYDTVCGQYPGIFSPTSYFRKWIRDTTGI